MQLIAITNYNYPNPVCCVQMLLYTTTYSWIISTSFNITRQ